MPRRFASVPDSAYGPRTTARGLLQDRVSTSMARRHGVFDRRARSSALCVQSAARVRSPGIRAARLRRAQRRQFPESAGRGSNLSCVHPDAAGASRQPRVGEEDCRRGAVVEASGFRRVDRGGSDQLVRGNLRIVPIRNTRMITIGFRSPARRSPLRSQTPTPGNTSKKAWRDGFAQPRRPANGSMAN